MVDREKPNEFAISVVPGCAESAFSTLPPDFFSSLLGFVLFQLGIRNETEARLAIADAESKGMNALIGTLLISAQTILDAKPEDRGRIAAQVARILSHRKE